MALVDFLIVSFGGILVIGCLSYLYKDTIFFRWAENTVVGAGAGYALVVAISTVYNQGIAPSLKGDIGILIGLILGILMFFTLSKEYRWISRYPIVILAGTGTGVAARAAISSNFLSQILATVTPLGSGTTLWDTINALIVFVGVLSATSYFIFSREQTGTFGSLTKIGRAFMMATFGAGFANMMLVGVNLMIPQFKFVLGTWLGLIPV